MPQPKGEITRGTTNPNRLRRVDRWITWRCRDLLTSSDEPLVVDLGFGASPITTVELRQRLAVLNPQVRVVGLEIDRERVAAAQPFADPPALSFARGGFELAGLPHHVNIDRMVVRPLAQAAQHKVHRVL